MQPTYSPAVKGGTLGFAGGCLAMPVIFLLGVGCLLCVPIAGLVLGPMMMLAALAGPFIRAGTWHGQCPVCCRPLEISGSAVTCPDCKRRVSRRGSWFVVF